jgi:phosphoglucomutase
MVTENLTRISNCDNLPIWASRSIDELVSRQLVGEINNRFFRTLEFGTGGMLSGTIADVVTDSDRGNSKTNKLDFGAVGTGYLNDFNIIGAMVALFKYCSNFVKNNHRAHELPSVGITDDVGHFPKHFGELAASISKNLKAMRCSIHPHGLFHN